MKLWHTNGSPNLGQKTRPYNNQQQKKRIYKIIDFAGLVDHRIKLKECEKKDKYLDLGAFGTVTKGLLKGLAKLANEWRTIQTTALLRTARILKRVLETWGDLLSLKPLWKNYQLTLMWKNSKE